MLVRQGLEDGTQRLRGQLRDAAQEGQQDRYGGDQIEGAAARGVQQAGRGLDRALHLRKADHSDGPAHRAAAPDAPAPEAASGAETAPGPETASRPETAIKPAAKQPPQADGWDAPYAPQEPSRAKIKTREVSEPPVTGRDGQRTLPKRRGDEIQIRQKDTEPRQRAVPGQSGGPARQNTAVPILRRDAAPIREKESAPHQREEVAPHQSTEPKHQSGAVQIRQRDPVSVQERGSCQPGGPTGQNAAIRIRQRDTASIREKKAAPHQREGIAPAQPIDAAPDHPKGRPDQPQIKTREAAAHATPKDSGPFLGPTEQTAQTPDGLGARSATPQIKTREAVQAAHNRAPMPAGKRDARGQPVPGSSAMKKENFPRSTDAPQADPSTPGERSVQRSVRKSARKTPPRQTIRRGGETTPSMILRPGYAARNRDWKPPPRTVPLPAQAAVVHPASGVRLRHRVREAKAVEREAQKTVKTAERSAKRTVKAAERAVKTAKASTRTGRRAVHATEKAVEAAVKAARATLRVARDAARTLFTAIAAGGWVVIAVVLVICLLGLLLASPFGSFFADESAGPNTLSGVCFSFALRL